MKILHMNTSDRGGAGRAASRLNQGLQNLRQNSQLLVQAKFTDDETIISPSTKLGQVLAKLRPSLSRLPLSVYPDRVPTDYSPSWLPDQVTDRVKLLQPDIINLHWICDGHVEVKTLAHLSIPLVWTLHDMWLFTGGCHYSQTCDRYTQTCGSCPQLRSQSNWDLSHWQWQHKAKALKPLNLTLVSPSTWLAKCAQNSSTLRNHRTEVIPNGLDSAIYKPIDRQFARTLLNLPQNKLLISFGAMQATDDKRKGFQLLQIALQELSKAGWQDRVELVVFGASRSAAENPLEIGFKSNYLGKLHDDISLSLMYAAMDVFVAPSTDDNLPNTVMEALACGTPCVAFQIGGMPDMIEHQRNGYLAQPYQIEDLAQGIAWILDDRERHQKLCDRARLKVEQEFTLEIQARRYLALYEELLSRKTSDDSSPSKLIYSTL